MTTFRIGKGQQARIEDRPPLIYHFTAKGDTVTTSMLGALLTLIKAAWSPTGFVSSTDMG
jgi:hypothetical protein